MEILEFLLYYLKQQFGNWKFSVTRWMFVLFPLWAFGIEVWNDRHALEVGFGAWHIMPKRKKIEECWRKTQRINPTSNDRASAKVVSHIGTIGSTKK